MKGITFDGDFDPLPVGCRTTCAAVIVVLSVVPSTRAVSPLMTALAGTELVSCSYFVDEVSSTVTFSPAEVIRSKPELDTPLTFPIDPPADGPDRALDSLPPGMPCAGVADAGDTAVAVPAPVLAVALTMPAAVPPIARVVAQIARDLVSLRENTGITFFQSRSVTRSLAIHTAAALGAGWDIPGSAA